jgi:hypothetical protein
MARYRIIPTSLTDPNDIARALGDSGLRDVEVHGTAQPLHDWIGRPTDVLANVIVRRKSIGASSDDLGFARNENGTYDALISDIHLFRFDRKWIQDLALRCGVTSPPASFETMAYVPQRKVPAPPLPPEHKNPGQALKVPPAPPKPVIRANLSSAAPDAARTSSSSAPLTVASGAAPSTLFGAGHVERAQHDATAIAERARKSGPKSSFGCLLFFLPLPVWLVLSDVSGGRFDIGSLVAMWVVWGFVYIVGFSVVAAIRLQQHAREFARRFPAEAKDRAVALAHLQSLADVKNSPMASTAARLLAEIRKSSTIRSAQHRGPTRRG